MTRTSLVTGGAGFMGSHVVRYCLERGDTVIVIDDLSGGFRENIPAGAVFVQGSVTDEETVNEVFDRYPVTVVYHLAAYAAEGLSHFIRRFNYINNVIGSINLINAAVNSGGVERFVFTSSIAVYGSAQVPMHEGIVPEPEDPYGIAKYAIELDLQAAHEMFGLSYTVFRPHNVYGEHQNIGDRYRNVVGIFMNCVMQGKPMPVFGDGLQTRAFTHIDDVAPIIAACVDVPGARESVFNIGSEAPRTILDVANAVAVAFGVDPHVEFLPARHEVTHAFSSSERSNAVFGNQKSPLSLEVGIARMAEWAKKVGPRNAIRFKSIEVPKNMPTSWCT